MAVQGYTLAVIIAFGGTALAVVFLMASVTFLGSPKQLLIHFIPSAVHEYIPINHISAGQSGYYSPTVDNGSHSALYRLLHVSTTRRSTTTHQRYSTTTTIPQPVEETRAQVLSVLDADNDVENTDEGLNEINSHQHPLDPPLTAPVDSTPGELLGLTMARLNFRARQRLTRAGVNLAVTADLLAEYQTSNHSAPLLACNFDNQGGLGNWMFMVASAFGIARTTHRVPVVLHDYSWATRHLANFSLQRMNRSTFLGNDTEQAWQEALRHEYSAGKFRAELTSLTTEKNVVVSGYLQSWKYFDAHRDDIRSLFAFSDAVYNHSLNKIETLLKSYYDSSREPLRLRALVGIHVRRGDITSAYQINYGYQPATEEYLLRAAMRFQQDYDPVVFIVVSNDIAYCRQLFAGLGHFLFSDNTGREEDMATMGLMDYLILSVGTYSWWAGYLSDAKKIMYFKDWPRKGSEMKKLYRDEDFFYPTWTPYE